LIQTGYGLGIHLKDLTRVFRGKTFLFLSLKFRLNTKIAIMILLGSRRRLRAISMRSDLFVACYEYGEEIDIERNGLAPFEHHDDPKLYERLLKAYLLRDKLPELMKSRQQPKATSPSTEPRATR
jgi:hypothetical protein